MNFNDEGTLTLRGDTTQFDTQLKELNSKAKELKTTLKEIETSGAGKGSQEWKDYKTQLEAVRASQAALNAEMKKMDVADMTLGQLKNHIKDLNKEMTALVPGTKAFNDAAARLGEAEKHFNSVNKQVKEIKQGGEDLGEPGLWSKITNGAKGLTTVFSGFIALAAVQFLYDMGKAIFDITAKFEKYEKVLTTALGSEKLAKQSMEAIKVMAANTAFSVDELTEGYVKMVNRGLRPSQTEMTALADLAASQGKTFDQLVEAVLDAQTAEFERLKEFGIKAKKEGDNVSLSFKGQTQVVKNNEEAILAAIIAMGAMTGVAGQNAKMMETLGGKTSNLGDSFDSMMVTLGTGLRPVFIAILDLLSASIPVLLVVGQTIGSVIVFAKSLVVGLVETVKNGGMAIVSLAEAATQVTQGNLTGAKKSLDDAVNYGNKTITSMKSNIEQGVQEVTAIWKNPNAEAAAEFAGKTQGKKFQGELTDAQKKAAEERQKEVEKELERKKKEEEKHLEDVKKANAKAIEEIAALDAEANIAGIRDELQREVAKIEEKKRKRIAEINDSLADDQYKKRLLDAAEKAATAEIEKVQEEHRQKRLKAEAEAEKQRLEAANFIREQEKRAETAILDWRELSAKGNSKLLTQIAKERVDTELRFKKEQYEQQEAADKAKATREIKDSDQLEAALLAIEKRYHNDSVLAEADAAEKKKKIDADLKKEKNENLKGYSDMFSNLLSGNLVAFAEGAQKMVKGHKAAWQEKIEEDMGKYEMVASMAQTAVKFLNDLAQKKAQREIELAQKERDEKVALLQSQLDQNARDQEMAAIKEEALKTELSNDLQNLKDAETKRLQELEQILTSTTTSEEEKKAAMREEYSQEYQILITNEKNKIETLTVENTNKIKALETQKENTLKLLNEEMNAAKTENDRKAVAAKIEAAEKEMDAKIKAATEEKEKSIQMAIEAKDAKIKAATEEKDNKLKALETLNLNEKKNTDELMKVAKDASSTRISDSEKERDRKLTVAANEKANLIKNQKDLQNAITAENDKARATEVNAKRNAWKAQQKADIASAIIAGALATIKALASGFFPVNLVFAAATAVATGIQVAMIKRQPEPMFALGGITQGSRHGRKYGESGLAIVDRRTGREAGEMEGGEAIISREQTEANLPLIHAMFRNARTPGRQRMALRPPIGLAEGGIMKLPKLRMFEYGGRPSYDDNNNFDGGNSGANSGTTGSNSSSDSSGGDSYSGSSDGGGLNEAEARAAGEEAKKQGERQLKLLEDIVSGVKGLDATTAQMSDRLSGQLNDNRGALGQVESAVRAVEGAVNGSNQSGRLDAILGAISNFGG
jgi:hypothetical protein